MWWSRNRSNDVWNVLFDAALDFGKNWRRDVSWVAAERLTELDDRGARRACTRDRGNPRRH